MTIALPALGGLVIVLWVIAIALLIAVILGFVAGVLHGLPYPINQLAGPVNSLASGISNACYQAIHITEKYVGAALHHLARYADKVWHSIETGQAYDYQAAKVAEIHAHAINRLGTRQHALARAAPTAAGQIRDLRREYNGIAHQVRDLQRELGHGIGDDVLPRIKRLEREAAQVRKQIRDVVIPAENTLTGEIGNIFDWARGKAALLGIGTFATAVAAALGLKSLSGFLCNEFRNILGRGCSGLWGGLDDLLGLFVDVLIFTNVCDILDFLSPLVSDIAAPVVTALSDVGAGLCKGGIGSPGALGGPQPTPPGFYTGTPGLPG